jgi:hypothetical protein
MLTTVQSFERTGGVSILAALLNGALRKWADAEAVLEKALQGGGGIDVSADALLAVEDLIVRGGGGGKTEPYF